MIDTKDYTQYTTNDDSRYEYANSNTWAT